MSFVKFQNEQICEQQKAKRPKESVIVWSFCKNSLKLIGRKKQPDTKEKGHVKTVNNGFQHVRDLYMTKDDQ